MSLKNEIFSISKKDNHIIIKFFGIKIKYFSKKLYLKNTEIRLNSCQKKIFALQQILNIYSTPKTLPPAKGELRQGQLLSIRLLNDIKGICDGNNLTYWLDFGTLLGAVRHGGYIPWDSDIDTSMLREDFYKVIPLLKEKYKDTEIEVREFGYTNHFQIRIQPKNDDTYGVDIFPVDKYFKGDLNKDEIPEVNLKIKKATKLLKMECKKSQEMATNPKQFRACIEQMNKKYVLEGNTLEVENPALYYAIDYPLPDENLTKNYELIFPLSKIKFEGEEFKCPNNVEQCLISLYGNSYMNYPSEFKPGEDKIVEYVSGLHDLSSN